MPKRSVQFVYLECLEVGVLEGLVCFVERRHRPWGQGQFADNPANLADISTTAILAKNLDCDETIKIFKV